MLHRKSVPQQIREMILKRIGSGELQSGDRIVEARIAEEFGVSAIPVREAIRELVAMHILECAPHRGAWVREISLQETIEALQVREAIEGLAAREATPSLKGKCDGLFETAHRIIESAKQGDCIAFQELNQNFHRAIIDHCGNEVLRRVWESLGFQVRARIIIERLPSADLVSLAEEHLAIAEAIQSGEADLASHLLAAHSHDLVESFREEMAQQYPETV